MCLFFVILLRHFGILFNGSPKPEACWSCRSLVLFEELILTAGALSHTPSFLLPFILHIINPCAGSWSLYSILIISAGRGVIST